MADQPVLSQDCASESVVTLTGDMSTGRQLRKSCRFCRSRKIRCSGETDIGCLACRNRNQKCIYEPTAAMGRPRKYPRTEYYGELGASMPTDPHYHAPAHCFQRGWPHSPLFMRALQPHEYWQGPPRSFESAQAAWRPLDEPTRSSAFNLSPPANPRREPPIIPTLAGLPMPAALSHRNAPFPDNLRATDSVLLDRILSTPNSATSLGSSVNFHHVSTSQPEFQGAIEARFQQTRRVPLEQNQFHNASTDLTGDFFNGDHSKPQSPTSVVPSDPQGPNTSFDTHEIISTCDAGHIFKHFKGNTLHVATQAHLQFILREYPNRHVSVSPHKHPSVLEPSLYYTMLADAVSWIACGQASVSDRQDGSLNTHEPLFTQMLNFDRGGNTYQESMIAVGEGGLNPLEQLSTQELNFMYSQWLRANPFAFLFDDAVPNRQAIYRPENSALLATVVGWHLYLSSRSRNYDPAKMTNHRSQNISSRSHMPFFEYAEAELMESPMCINRSTLSIVQALILLGAFRSVDSQARCGWALLSIAHLLAKQYLSPTNGLKRSRSANGELDMQENKMIGINWLMCLYKSWTMLSMKFPKTKVHSMIEGAPSYFEAYLGHARVTSSGTRTHANTEWANRTLLNASQILEVFCILCQEGSSNPLLRDPTANFSSNDQPYEANLYLTRWLMDTAKRRCQVMGSYDSPPSGSNNRGGTCEIRNAHVNVVLALVFSIFALGQLAPFENMTSTNFVRIPNPIFRDILKLLQMISAEGAGSVLASVSSLHHTSALGEALLLRILRGFFPYLLIFLQAFANTLPDYCNTSATDSHHAMTQLLEVIESLGKFASAGLSLYPLEDLQVIEDIRLKVISLSANLSTSSHVGSNQEQEAFQPPDSVPLFEMTSRFAEASQSRSIAHDPLESTGECVVPKRDTILTNNYSSESTNFVGSYSAPTFVESNESTLSHNNGTQLSHNLMISTDVGVSSSPPLSDPPSSISYPFQFRQDQETKTEDLFVPSQGTNILLSFSDSESCWDSVVFPTHT